MSGAGDRRALGVESLLLAQPGRPEPLTAAVAMWKNTCYQWACRTMQGRKTSCQKSAHSENNEDSENNS
jgi:hypothetical protein